MITDDEFREMSDYLRAMVNFNLIADWGWWMDREDNCNKWIDL